MGLVSSASVANPADPHWRKPTASAYAQDTWKITGNFTLDYGVRWDYQGYPYEEQDRRSMFDPNVANPAAGGLKGATSYEGGGAGAMIQRVVRGLGQAGGHGMMAGGKVAQLPEDRAARQQIVASIRERFLGELGLNEVDAVGSDPPQAVPHRAVVVVEGGVEAESRCVLHFGR